MSYWETIKNRHGDPVLLETRIKNIHCDPVLFENRMKNRHGDPVFLENRIRMKNRHGDTVLLENRIKNRHGDTVLLEKRIKNRHHDPVNVWTDDCHDCQADDGSCAGLDGVVKVPGGPVLPHEVSDQVSHHTEDQLRDDESGH